jgi:hypothetical protein
MFGTRYASATDASTAAADDDPRISAPRDTTVSSMSAGVIGPAASIEEQRNPSGRRSFGAMGRLFEDEEHQGWG